MDFCGRRLSGTRPLLLVPARAFGGGLKVQEPARRRREPGPGTPPLQPTRPQSCEKPKPCCPTRLVLDADGGNLGVWVWQPRGGGFGPLRRLTGAQRSVHRPQRRPEQGQQPAVWQRAQRGLRQPSGRVLDHRPQNPAGARVPRHEHRCARCLGEGGREVVGVHVGTWQRWHAALATA